MFDEHDHRTLDELEWNLSMGDPDFVGRFDRGQQRMSARFRQRRGNRIALLTALSVGVLLLLLGTAAGAVAAMLTTGLVWLAWRYPNLFIGSSPS
ncbi:DUF3040 domain-containing protein [Pseudonocardia sp. NPDC049154]|uniref:DUF3040 domain-containing protein n=1 Tax=Pseudonocardia sp. NPDC049154 TaxID=3155501 RepID=UPI0033F1822A